VKHVANFGDDQTLRLHGKKRISKISSKT